MELIVFTKTAKCVSIVTMTNIRSKITDLSKPQAQTLTEVKRYSNVLKIERQMKSLNIVILKNNTFKEGSVVFALQCVQRLEEAKVKVVATNESGLISNN